MLREECKQQEIEEVAALREEARQQYYVEAMRQASALHAARRGRLVAAERHSRMG